MARLQTTTETQTSSQEAEAIPTTTAHSPTHREQRHPLQTCQWQQHLRRKWRKRHCHYQHPGNGADSPSETRNNARAATNETKGHSSDSQTKKGQEIKALSDEDEPEAATDFFEHWVNNTWGLNRERKIEGMKQEVRSMKGQKVYTEEVPFSNLTRAQQSKVIKWRWVLRQKGNSVRARTVAKGYTEVKDNDDIYASAPAVNVCPYKQLDRQNRRDPNSFPTRKGRCRRPVRVPTSRVLQPRRQHSLEAQQSNLRTTRQPKGMAESF